MLKIAAGFDRTPEIDGGIHLYKKRARVEECLNAAAINATQSRN